MRMKNELDSSKDGAAPWDAVLVQSRRELIGILIIWMIFAVWVVGASALTGYRPAGEEIDLVVGIPAWVFWSVGVPWLGSNVAIFWFCLRVMKDQSLETSDSDADTRTDR
jgi:hypothetical protein